MLLAIFGFATKADAQVIIFLDEYCATMYNQASVTINFSPNPADEELNLSNEIDFDIRTVIIQDLYDNVVLEQTINSPSTKLNVSGIDNGTYILTIITGCGEGSAQLIVSH